MPMTHIAEIADTYLRLGGRRRAVIDDNQVSTRIWDGEPQAAAEFWRDSVGRLSDKERRELETLLPTINRH